MNSHYIKGNIISSNIMIQLLYICNVPKQDQKLKNYHTFWKIISSNICILAMIKATTLKLDQMFTVLTNCCHGLKSDVYQSWPYIFNSFNIQSHYSKTGANVFRFK